MGDLMPRGGTVMHPCASASPSFGALIHESIRRVHLFQLAIQSLKTFRLGKVVILVAAFCLANCVAQSQSTPSRATISFGSDSANCSFSDPDSGWIYNFGTISITINSTETESALYACITAGAPYDYIQNLANAINQNSPWVTAIVLSDSYFGGGGSILLTSKA